MVTGTYCICSCNPTTIRSRKRWFVWISQRMLTLNAEKREYLIFFINVKKCKFINLVFINVSIKQILYNKHLCLEFNDKWSDRTDGIGESSNKRLDIISIYCDYNVCHSTHSDRKWLVFPTRIN